MNKVSLIGRLTHTPDIRNNGTTFAKFTLAVDRRFKKDGEQSTDFINCIAFGKTAEVIEKYVSKGTKIAIVGRIQAGSYTNKQGQKVYTTDVIVEEMDFCESRGPKTQEVPAKTDNDMDFIPVGSMDDEDTPF